MTLAAGFALTLALAVPAGTYAQSSDNEQRKESVEVIRLAHIPNNNNAASDLVTALRNTASNKMRIYLDSSQSAVVVRGTAEEIEQAHKVVAELDKPIALYKITYSITKVEDGKRTGTQHYTLLAAAGQRADFKEGRRVPIVTGKTGSDNAAAETQFQYVDIGLSISATLDGTSLKSKVEESAVADEKSTVGIQDPVIRQISLESIATITPGKPATLGALDIPNSTQHQEVEVLVERVQ
jgi:type II secretory pathway component GspD/PulD (secretin)